MDLYLRYPKLRSIDLLHDIPQDRANAFLKACKIREYPKSASIIVQGEHPEGVFFVAKGGVEISFVNPEGDRAILRIAQSPNCLGLFEAVANRPCAATCTALPDCEILFCPTSVVREHLLDPTFIRNFATIGCKILEHDNTYKAVDQFFGSEQRIGRYLQKFAGDAMIFDHNQSYLANVVGCTRQTVNKELSHLRERSVISIEKGRITILDPLGLEKRIKELDDGARSQP